MMNKSQAASHSSLPHSSFIIAFHPFTFRYSPPAFSLTLSLSACYTFVRFKRDPTLAASPAPWRVCPLEDPRVRRSLIFVIRWRCYGGL